MGIKMGQARMKDTGTVRLISELSKDDKGNIECVHCGVDIKYTGSYPKRVNGENRIIQAYLSQWPDRHHEEGCPYNVKAAVKAFVAESQAVEDVRPVFDEVFGGGCSFNLNLIVDSLKIAPKVDGGGALGVQGTEYIQTGEQLSRFIRSATGIAKIRALLDSSDDIRALKEEIKIVFNGREITWGDFFFDDQRYHILSDRLSKTANGFGPHPVAMQVKFKEIAENEFDGVLRVQARCFKGKDRGEGDTLELFIPKVSSVKENIFRRFQVEKEYVVVGVSYQKVNGKFKNIFIKLHNPNQIKKTDFSE